MAESMWAPGNKGKLAQAQAQPRSTPFQHLHEQARQTGLGAPEKSGRGSSGRGRGGDDRRRDGRGSSRGGPFEPNAGGRNWTDSQHGNAGGWDSRPTSGDINSSVNGGPNWKSERGDSDSKRNTGTGRRKTMAEKEKLLHSIWGDDSEDEGTKGSSSPTEVESGSRNSQQDSSSLTISPSKPSLLERLAPPPSQTHPQPGTSALASKGAEASRWAPQNRSREPPLDTKPPSTLGTSEERLSKSLASLKVQTTPTRPASSTPQIRRERDLPPHSQLPPFSIAPPVTPSRSSKLAEELAKERESQTTYTPEGGVASWADDDDDGEEDFVQELEAEWGIASNDVKQEAGAELEKWDNASAKDGENGRQSVEPSPLVEQKEEQEEESRPRQKADDNPATKSLERESQPKVHQLRFPREGETNAVTSIVGDVAESAGQAPRDEVRLQDFRQEGKDEDDLIGEPAETSSELGEEEEPGRAPISNQTHPQTGSHGLPSKPNVPNTSIPRHNQQPNHTHHPKQHHSHTLYHPNSREMKGVELLSNTDSSTHTSHSDAVLSPSQQPLTSTASEKSPVPTSPRRERTERPRPAIHGDAFTRLSGGFLGGRAMGRGGGRGRERRPDAAGMEKQEDGAGSGRGTGVKGRGGVKAT